MINQREKCYIIEAEANIFARHLLMPDTEMNKIINEEFENQLKCIYDKDVLYSSLIKLISDKFGVEETQAKLRLCDFGLINGIKL